MRRKILAPLVAALVTTTTIGAPLCDGSSIAWQKEFKSKGSSGTKYYALESCHSHVHTTLLKQTATCEGEGKVPEFKPGSQCQPQDCRYYGKPVNAWFCYHTLQFACCN